MNSGILILRLAIGLTLSYHGTQKLFGWFGGYGLKGTSGFMLSLGFGKRAAFMAGMAETFGGLFLALGLATPAAAAVIFSVMLVASVTVHLKNGFSIAKTGYEYTMVLGLSALSLAFIGPGRFSLDAVLDIARSGWMWGLGAFLVGAAGGGLQIAMRKAPAPAAAPVPAAAK